MARPARGGCRLLILLEPLVSFTELVNQVTAVQGSFTPITDSCLKMKINKLNLVLLDMLDTVLCGHDLNKAFLFSYAKQNFCYCFYCFYSGRRGGLMDSALTFGSSSLGLEPSWGHYVVILDKILYSQCISPPRCANLYWQI